MTSSHSITLTGLTPNTTYHFQVGSADVSSNIATSSDLTFRTAALQATTYTFTGPSSGNINSPSGAFTVTPNNAYTGTITITPTGAGSVGLSPVVLTFNATSTAQTFAITPTVSGSITLTPINSGSLSNPSSLSYTSNVIIPSAPTGVSAVAGNSQATISFVPGSNGGSSILYYLASSTQGNITATSSASPIVITGLTNGSSYAFVVYAVNAVGSSSPSAVSNTVTPASGVIPAVTVTAPSTNSYSSGSISSSQLAAILAPSPAATAYLNSLNHVATPVSIPSPAYTFARDLSFGSSGIDVKKLQQYLNTHGFIVAQTGVGSLGHETSNFGPLTKRALIDFQKAHGISATGTFGPITRGVVGK